MELLRRFGYVFFFIGIFLHHSVFAHRPRMVSKTIVEVKEPSISQAFYGELAGNSHYFTFNSNEDFRLFVNVMVPDIEGVQTDLVAQIVLKRYPVQDDSLIARLIGSESQWKPYYEEFVGDHYLIGPAFTSDQAAAEIPLKGIDVPSGKYEIELFSKRNAGKYVLAIGEQEQWPLKEIWNAVMLFPDLKRFFLKSPYRSVLDTPAIALFHGVFLLVICLVIWLTYEALTYLRTK